MTGIFLRLARLAPAIGLAVSLQLAPHAANADVILAFSGPLTGIQAENGEEMERGAELAVDDWNAKGGVLGEKIQLLKIDDQDAVEAAVGGAQKAVQGGAFGVVGFFYSNVASAARPTYLNNGLLFAPSAASAGEVLGDAENKQLVFRTVGLTSEANSIQASFLLDVVGAKKIAVLHDRGDWGKEQAEAVRDIIAKGGKAQVVLFDGITVGEQDFRGLVTQIMAAGAEAVFFAGHHPEAAAIIKQLHEAGWKGTFSAPDSLFQPYIKLAGADAEGTFMLVGAGPDVVPAAKAYAAAFKAKYGVGPGLYAMSTYTAVDLVLGGLKATGKKDQTAVVKWVRSNEHDTIMGKVTFNADGEIVGFPWVMNEVKGGQFVPIGIWNPKTHSFDKL
jgi:branched-chain amino acid transport system substrate-binding protein